MFIITDHYNEFYQITYVMFFSGIKKFITMNKFKNRLHFILHIFIRDMLIFFPDFFNFHL